MDENKNPVMQQALKFGLIMGMFNVIIQLLFYMINKEWLVSLMMNFVILIVNIILVIYPIRQLKKQQGGLISFKDAFIMAFIIFAGSGLIGTVFQYILYAIIDPGLPEYVKQKAIENTVSMMEKFGSSQDDVAKAIEPLEQQDFKPNAKSLGTQYFWSILFSAFFALILGAIFKKSPKTEGLE